MYTCMLDVYGRSVGRLSAWWEGR